MSEREKYRESVGLENQPDSETIDSQNGLAHTQDKPGRDTIGTGKEGALISSITWNSPLIWLIQFYQRYITHLLPPSCRFEPSCSHYALQAFRKYPFFKALYLSIRRLLKCHPFHKGGFDPLP
jgi:uncharacterized protein